MNYGRILANEVVADHTTVDFRYRNIEDVTSEEKGKDISGI